MQQQIQAAANNGLSLDNHAAFANHFTNAAQQLASATNLSHQDILQQYQDTIKSFNQIKQFSNFDLANNGISKYVNPSL